MDNPSWKTTDIVSPEMNWLVAVRRHSIAAVVVAAMVFGVLAYKTLREPGVYRSEALILVANKSSVPIFKGDQTSADDTDKSLPTDIEILQGTTLLSRAINKLSPIYRNIHPSQIQQNLSLSQPRETNVLSVSYQDNDAIRAKAILDAIVSTYIDYSVESRRSPVTNAIRFLESKLPKVKADLNKSSSALTRFRTNYNLDNPDNNVNLAYSNKEQIKQTIDVAKIDLNQLEQRYHDLQRQLTLMGQDPQTAVSDAVLSQDNTYKYLLNQLTMLEVQYKLEQTRYTPDHPIIQDLKERRDTLKQLLQAESQKSLRERKSTNSSQKVENGAIQQELVGQLIQTRLNILTQKKRLSDLQQQAIRANLKFREMIKLQQQYNELDLQYRFNAQMAGDFSAKLQNLRIQEAQDTSTWKVIESPKVPTAPMARSGTKGLVPGGIMGILVGVGVALLLEKIDSSLKDIGEIQKVTQLPILGIIPQFQTALSVGLGSDSFTESVRSLALTLSFQNSQTLGKIIAVTSAITGEGKTTITYNLGLALAELGKRILIVDGNFSHPTLHQVFSLSNTQGLTTALATPNCWQQIVQYSKKETVSEQVVVEEVKSLEDLSLVSNLKVIESTEKNENENGSSAIFAKVSTAARLRQAPPLPYPSVERYPDVLTSGPVGTNAFPWLVSQKMIELLEQWRQAYDYVLLDTSALTGLADAQSITPKVDEVILVVSQRRVETSMVTEALKILQRNNSRLVGVVVNTLGRGKNQRQHKLIEKTVPAQNNEKSPANGISD